MTRPSSPESPGVPTLTHHGPLRPRMDGPIAPRPTIASAFFVQTAVDEGAEFVRRRPFNVSASRSSIDSLLMMRS